MASGKTTRRKPPPRPPQARRLTKVRAELWTNLPAVAPESLAGLRADVKQARDQYRLGHHEDAERVLVRPLRALPGMAATGDGDGAEVGATWASAWAVLARTRAKLDHPRQAHSAFERAAKLFDEHIAALPDPTGEDWLDYGVALEHLARNAEALKAFERAEALGLATSETYRHMGFALRERDPAQAERWFRRSVERAPEDPYALRVLAEHLRDRKPDEAGNLFRDAAFASGTRGDIEGALRTFDDALQLRPDDPDALAGKAEMLRVQDESEEAVPLFERSLEIRPGVAWIMAGKGAAMHGLGDDLGALATLDETLALDPGFVFAIGTKGRVLRELGRLDESEALLRTVEVDDPSAAWILVELAETQRRRGDDPGALDSLERAIDLTPRDAAARAARAAVHLALGDRERALYDIERSLELRRDLPFAHAVHGQLLYHDEQFEAAAHALRKAVNLAPDDPRYVTLLGETLRLSGDLEEALGVLDAALALDDGFAPALVSKGAVLDALKRYEEAREALDRALRVDDFVSPFALTIKARVMRELDEPDEAEACFREALELDPGQPLVLAELAELVRNRGRNPEAVELSRRALELDAALVPALVTQAQALRAQGLYTQALAPLQTAVDLNPEDPLTLAHLGDTILMLGDAGGALTVLDRAVAIDPEDDFALATKGQALRLLGRLDEAIACLRAAIGHAEDAGWIHAELGEALRLSGRQAEALREFDLALELDEDNPWALAGRGSVLRAMQRYLQALEMFDQALRRQRMPFALSAKAMVLIDIGRYREAIELLDEVLEAEPDAWCLRLKGWAAELLEEGEPALAAYQAAQRLEPDSLWAKRGVAEAQLLLGNRDAAIAGFGSIVQHVSSSESVEPSEMALIGWAYLRLAQLEDDDSERQHELAVRYLGKALAFVEDVVPVQLDLALALMSSGRYRHSCQAYSRGIASAKDLPPLRRHAVLEVARNDLRSTRQLVPGLENAAEVDSTLASLEEAMRESKAQAEKAEEKRRRAKERPAAETAAR